MELAIKRIFRISNEEAELVDGCLKNDRHSQKRLYYKYCDAMYTVVYRILNDGEEANDILQDGFIQVFTKMEQFRKESSLGAWIKTIILRTALNRLKEKNKNMMVQLDENKHDSVVFNANTLDGKVLEQAILSLPDGYRTVFLLAEVEGYKHKEIADMLDISEGTSKSQLFHAKQMLRDRLKYLI